jgi:hypothetical protein
MNREPTAVTLRVILRLFWGVDWRFWQSPSDLNDYCTELRTLKHEKREVGTLKQTRRNAPQDRRLRIRAFQHSNIVPLFAPTNTAI